MLAGTIVQRADAGLYFRLCALALPLSVLGNVMVNWLRMQRRPKMTVVLSLIFNLLNVPFIIVFVAFLQWGISGVYVVQIITAVAGTITCVVLMRDWLSPTYFHLLRLRKMIRYSLPLIPGTLAFWVVSFSDRFFVQVYTNTEEVGLYQVGSSMAGLIALATGAFQTAWVPFSMSIHKRDDANMVYASVLLSYLWLTSLISTFLALLAPEAIRLIATERYVGASPVVGILAFGYVMMGLGSISTLGPSIVKKTSVAGFAMIAAAGINIVLNILFVPGMGKIGAALATLMSQAVVPAYLFYHSQKLYPIPYRFKPAIGILVLSFVIIALGANIQFDNVWVNIFSKFTLIASFVPALFLLRVITPDQARSLLYRLFTSKRYAV
ncbi:MAG: polysaccharide biosynthesis C-terminal domain-containing protein [Chloroflexi bacterium]|nr:polysaccharide biosynthesis C-terminal domain-containing protein [Chloroflexota bacterium]